MRICIICGSYREGLGYQENFWAEELAYRGNSVRVIAAAENGKNIGVTTASCGKYEVSRVPTLRLPHAILLSKHVGNEIHKYRPDCIFWIAIPQYFGRAILCDSSLAYLPFITFFSENPGMHSFYWREPGLGVTERCRALGYQFLRGPIVRNASRRSMFNIGACPTTCEILGNLFPPGQKRDSIAKKTIFIPLGFNHRQYYFDEELRAKARKEFKLNENSLVVCASSRFESGKKRTILDATISGILRTLEMNREAKAIIVGFGENAVSYSFRKQINSSPVGERVQCVPFSDQSQLNKIYNASDIAVFGNATVSCQAALGTGLICCIPDNGTMEHLISVSNQGHIYQFCDSIDLSRAILSAIERITLMNVNQRMDERRLLSKASRWLRYDGMASFITELISENSLGSKKQARKIDQWTYARKMRGESRRENHYLSS